MEVSVIIPVYNAEAFVASAVASALAEPETAEVLLVEDGSRDGSLSICESLTRDPRLRLLTHPGNMNRGVSASRNLGIQHARYDVIAFLDADDIYLPGRFAKAAAIFAQHPDADGVHETIGVYYLNDVLKERHIARAGGENTGVRIAVQPAKLFRVLASGDHGHIHLNGLTVRKTALDMSSLFDEQFVLSEDVDFILRLAATRKLFGADPARIVALRGVHDANTVFTNPHAAAYRRRYLRKCIDHHFYGSQDTVACLHIIKRYIGASSVYAPFVRFGKIALPVKLLFITGFIVFHPKVLLVLISRMF